MANLLHPDSTIAIILGASDWTNIGLPIAYSHRRSAAYLMSYLIAPRPGGLGLKPDWILYLFDDPSEASKQLKRIEGMVAGLIEECKQEGQIVKDLLIYFVGHGALDNATHLHLLVQASRLGMELETSISTLALRKIIRTAAPLQRRILVLDCCFSEAALAAFAGQGTMEEAVASTAANDLKPDPAVDPDAGTLLLCSSPKREVSLGPPKAERTLFTGALLTFLGKGAASVRSDMLSFAELRDCIYTQMTEDFKLLHNLPGQPPRPALHQPEQQAGDLLLLPAFPNVGFRPAPSQAKRAPIPGPVGADLAAYPDEMRQKVSLEALTALAGADSLHKKLLASLSLGSASVEAAAHLIKGRVKEHRKIVEKVLEKRKTKPDYQASDVTDVVGLRLLTLYRSDLPRLLQRFLRFVEQGRGEPLELFHGKTLDDTIQELIIYGYPEKEALCQSLFSQLKQFNLVQDGERIRYELKDSGYSSIHIILRAQVTNGKEHGFMPIEVQIRTALEDAWGEVDHELAYKSKIGNPEGANVRLWSNAQEHLVNLKQLLDTCGRTADTIKGLIVQIFQDDETSSPVQAYKSVDDQLLMELNLPSPHQQRLNAAVTEATELFESMRGPRKTRSTAAVICRLAELAATFDAVSADLQKGIRRPDAVYLINMETALCLLWIGRLLEEGSGSMSTEEMDQVQAILRKSDIIPRREMKDELMLTASEILDEAARRYFEIGREPERARDPLVAFRLGEVFSARRNAEVALGQFEEALKWLSDDRKLRPDHPLRIEIPRRLGYAYWESADQLRKAGMQVGNTQFLISRQLEYLLEAIEVTWKSYQIALTLMSTGNATDEIKRELMLSANNLLDYSVTFLQMGGSEDMLAGTGVERALLQSLLKEHLAPSPSHVEQIERPAVVDTVRSAAKFLSVEELEWIAALRVRTMLARDWSNRYDPDFIREMEAEAQASINRLRDKMGGDPETR